MEEFDEINQKLQQEQEQQGPVKKGANGKLFLAIILVIIIGVVLAFSLKMKNPKFVFNAIIDKAFDSISFEDYKTCKMNFDFEANVEGEGTEEIQKIFNDLKIGVEVEGSKETNEAILALNLEKEKTELIDAKMKVDTDAKKMYLDLGEFFNKTLEIDITEELEDSETDSTEDLNFVEKFTQKLSGKKAISIIKSEIKSELKDKYFSTEKAELDGEKVTKDTFSISSEELMEITENVIDNLNENKKFLNCWQDEEEIQTILMDLKDELSEVTTTDEVMEISIYSKGLFKEFKGIEFAIEEAAIKVIKINETDFEYKYLEDDEVIFDGTVKVEENDDVIDVELALEVDGVKLTYKYAIKIVYDEEISEFNTNKTVNVEELTQNDLMAIYSNFMGSDLYKMVEGITGTSSSILSDDITDTSDEYDFSDITSNTNTLKEDETKNTTKEEVTTKNEVSTSKANEIKTYDGIEISMEIPAGYEEYSDSERYKMYKKPMDTQNIYVNLHVYDKGLNECIEDAKESADYFKENTDRYKNLNVDVQEVTVNGNKFNKVLISYDYIMWDGTIDKRSDAHFVYKIDEKHTYVAEMEKIHLMTDDEVNKFLTIQK